MSAYTGRKWGEFVYKGKFWVYYLDVVGVLLVLCGMAWSLISAVVGFRMFAMWFGASLIRWNTKNHGQLALGTHRKGAGVRCCNRCWPNQGDRSKPHDQKQ